MRRALTRIATLSGLFAAVLPQSLLAGDANFRVLHSVCARKDCGSGGAGVAAGLLRDPAGNLFGATLRGGANGAGEIFELVQRSGKDGWNYNSLHSFCAKTGCADGAIVWGPLIRDTQGNLYGVTTAGGRGGFGTFFELMPQIGKSNWSYNVLYDFCANGGSFCTEAGGFNFGLTYAGAAAGLPYDGHAPLYGTSAQGGYAFGNIFELAPRLQKKMWSFRQVYEFCGDYPQCAGGGLPWMGNVVADASGHLYGTAEIGGANGGGVVYELTPGARKKHWTETILHSFCSVVDCADGKEPSGTLLLDGAGNLYGTTTSGSDNCADPARCGVMFKLAADSEWQETVLHTFCQESNCTDGSGAQGGLVMDEDGNLLGATYVGGMQNDGAVFQLGQSFSVLHSFCVDSGCSDGQYPWPAIAQDGSGNIFGITQNGGSASYGAVFEISK